MVTEISTKLTGKAQQAYATMLLDEELHNSTRNSIAWVELVCASMLKYHFLKISLSCIADSVVEQWPSICYLSQGPVVCGHYYY